MKRTSLDRVHAKHAISPSDDSYRAMRSVLDEIEGGSSDLNILFASSHRDLGELERALREVGVGPTLCCTTAGEIGVGSGHLKESLVGASLRGVRTEVFVIDDLATFGGERAAELRERMQPFLSSVKETETVAAIALLDGLSRREEWVVQELYQVLGGIPIVGGSAGDDLAFRETQVFCDGTFRSDVGAVALVATEGPMATFMKHHFEPSGELVAVTGADPVSRRVMELDGLPAGEAYRRATGLPDGPLPSEVMAVSPLMLGIGGRNYLRSIARETEQGHLELYCAIEEGLVLDLGRPKDLRTCLAELLEEVRAAVGEPELLIGFSTYGEIFGGLPVNQTLTGIAFGR